MHSIIKALELKSELDKLRPIDKAQEDRIMQKFRLDWNYHSNNLEGNSLSYGETKALILFGLTAQGKPLKDHFEITGHDEAIKWVNDIVKGEYPLNENFIRELHKLLLKEPYEVDAITPDGKPVKKKIKIGQYKTVPNHVLTKTGEIFRFATPEETPALMHDLINWYREKASEADVNHILLAAEFHYRFIRIHPFDDGNGRTARILMNFILMRFGYPPVIIKTQDKENYFFALRQADIGILEPFLDYIAKNLIRSLQIMLSGAQGRSIEEPDDLDKEISLLEQRFKAIGSKIEVSKTNESLLAFYDDTIERLVKAYIKTCEKFERFYLRGEFTLFNGKAASSNKLDALNTVRQYISEKDTILQLFYKYTSLNQDGYDQVNYNSQITIELGLKDYKVKDSSNSVLFIRKYGEQLSDEEINELIKGDAKIHRQFIEEKVQEIHNKKS